LLDSSILPFLSGGFEGKAFAAINIGRDYFTNPMRKPRL
jgi:hypothetical protein